jgi:hypothetical protein
MGFTKPDFPDVDPDTFLQKPLMERMRILGLNWAENGFGSPRMVHTVYIAKLVFFYALGAILVATLTSGLPAFWHVVGHRITSAPYPTTAFSNQTQPSDLLVS